MSLVSIEALILMPILLAVYWLSPRKASIQNLVLLVASYLFYATWHWHFLALVILGTLIDYTGTRAMLGATQRTKRLLLGVSLLYGLGTLGFFKYQNFFAESANTLLAGLGIEASFTVLNLLLPLGISFYTLQRLSYVFDVYLGRTAPAKNLLDFAAYCCFFPQLTAGPIARADELLHQLESPRYINFDRFFEGLSSIVVGYLLASWAAPIFDETLVRPTFNAVGELNAASHWLGAIGFALQVYSDFAGYTLIAIGIARLFAIELPQNFDAPFISRGVSEFWRRWHITLNRWLFDYIFTPMTTSRGWFRGRISLALLLTFLASGLWHGAAWTFILWGLIHAVAMIAQHNWDVFYRNQCRRDRKYVAIRKSRLYGLTAWTLTMLTFIISMVPFRSPDFPSMMNFVEAMFSNQGDGHLQIGGSVTLAFAFVLAMHIAKMPLAGKFVDGYQQRVPALVRGGIYGAIAALALTLVPESDGVFIYQGF